MTPLASLLVAALVAMANPDPAPPAEARTAPGDHAPPLLSVVSETVEGGTRTVRFALRDDAMRIQDVTWRGLAGGAGGGPVRVAPLFELELPAASDVEVVALDAAGGEVLSLLRPASVAPHLQEPTPDPAASAEVAPTEGFPWIVAGGVALGVVVAAAGLGAWLLLAPPPAVTVRTDVAFAE